MSYGVLHHIEYSFDDLIKTIEFWRSSYLNLAIKRIKILQMELVSYIVMMPIFCL